ncbi:TPA_asm: RNA-directed RNA polymerase [ssRNA phage SRR7976299_2]|uniref:RNA-directed RNA polymerase n=1 Tax=ssRNA phage SRR7976299_2 TaxID=2786642 RepID=A0A8S5L536_9VIRU|nr:RNA-directed RNA polymerase [ssRNA phage SRR7976299_2]DAD52667.1 TPA_asm: RNA-directed RNA polymerase [ssRNA phage SRR7976299_2]
MDFNPADLLKCLTEDFGYSEPLPLSSDLSVRDARKSSLLSSILKKYVTESSKELERKAIDGFLTSNAKCALWKPPCDDNYLVDVLSIARQIIHSSFYHLPGQQTDFHLENFLNFGRVGPGSSIGTKRTDFLGKLFEGALSTNSLSLYNHYRSIITGRWLAAEKLRTANFGTVISESSKLSTVPKNRETNRTICTEPSLNMFYQLGAGHIIETMLQRDHAIDFAVQPEINKDMARRGSIDGKFATIDLRSASDTISYALCQYLLPRQVLSCLDIIRSHSTVFDGQKIDLSMISSMGNGFTFPLQTLIFASLVRAVYIYMGITPNIYIHRNYSVFGDDIICLKEAYHVVCRVLNCCGFEVNDDKSFNLGAFRESCGGDFFRGDDIRGVYIKEVISEQDLYSVFNRLCRWSAKYSISLHCSLRYVKGLVDFRPVPLHAGDTEGHKIPASFLTSPKFDRNGSWIYRPTIPIRRTLSLDDVSYSNWHGRIIALIGGYIESASSTKMGRIGIRDQRTRYQVSRRVTPYWDYTQAAEPTPRDYFECLVDIL